MLKAYLAAPLTLYLGTDDIRPEHNFDESAEGMVQGKSRLERGRNCYAFAKALADVPTLKTGRPAAEQASEKKAK